MRNVVEKVVIMVEEPVQGKTADEVRQFFGECPAEQDLADAYALTSNQFWWVEDTVYDFEEGTQEYHKACGMTDEWRMLMNEYKEKIVAVLIREGSVLPEKKEAEVLLTFMKRNGYTDGDGWWIKKGAKCEGSSKAPNESLAGIRKDID